MKRLKTFWFRINGQRDIPVYERKNYKKARVKRQSERLMPGHWDLYVKGEEQEDGNGKEKAEKKD